MNCILLTEQETAEGADVRLNGRRALHMINVLHVTVGQQVRIGILNGHRGTGTVRRIVSDTVTLTCTLDADMPPLPRVDLLLALPRPKVMKRLWAPLASLGLGHIVVTNAAAVERPYFDTHWLEHERFEPLLIEGLEQSGDTRLPRVSIKRRLKPFLEDEIDDTFPDGARWLAHPAAETMRPPSAPPGERILVAIGPENGWTDYEVTLLRTHRFLPVSMGWRALRSDVAAIAMIALAHANLA